MLTPKQESDLRDFQAMCELLGVEANVEGCLIGDGRFRAAPWIDVRLKGDHASNNRILGGWQLTAADNVEICIRRAKVKVFELVGKPQGSDRC